MKLFHVLTILLAFGGCLGSVLLPLAGNISTTTNKNMATSVSCHSLSTVIMTKTIFTNTSTSYTTGTLDAIGVMSSADTGPTSVTGSSAEMGTFSTLTTVANSSYSNATTVNQSDSAPLSNTTLVPGAVVSSVQATNLADSSHKTYLTIIAVTLSMLVVILAGAVAVSCVCIKKKRPDCWNKLWRWKRARLTACEDHEGPRAPRPSRDSDATLYDSDLSYYSVAVTDGSTDTAIDPSGSTASIIQMTRLRPREITITNARAVRTADHIASDYASTFA